MKKINSIFELCIIADVVCLLTVAYLLNDNFAAMCTVLILAVVKMISNIAYVCQLFIKKEKTKTELILAIIGQAFFIAGVILMLFFKHNQPGYEYIVFGIITIIFSIVSNIITVNQKQKEEKE